MGVRRNPPRGHRRLPKSVRLNCHGDHKPSANKVDEACAQVLRSGVVPVLAARLHRRSDAEAALSLFGYEVALTLHSYTKNHRMELVEIVRLINSLGAHTLRVLGMPNWRVVGGYDRFQRLHTRVSAALDEGWRHVDAETGEITRIDRDWYLHRVMQAAIDLDLVRGCALSVDGTAMETWNNLHGHPDTIDLDGEPDRDDDE